MRFEDEFKITERYSGPVSLDALSDTPSSDRKPYTGLIMLLNREGANIDESNSEKEIVYDVKGIGGFEKRKSRVPLDFVFRRDKEDLKVVGYIFRAPNLELTISDYSECSGLDFGMDGGSVTAEKGVHCNVCFEGSYEECAIVEKVEKVVKEFYAIPEPSLSD